MTPEKFNAVRHVTYVNNTWLGECLGVDQSRIWAFSSGKASIPKVIAEKMYAFYGSFQNAALEICEVLSKSTPSTLLVFENDEKLHDFEQAYSLDSLARIASAPIDSTLYLGLIFAVDFLMSAIHERPVIMTQHSPHLPGEIRVLSTTDDNVNAVEFV